MNITYGMHHNLHIENVLSYTKVDGIWYKRHDKTLIEVPNKQVTFLLNAIMHDDLKGRENERLHDNKG